jgi:FlaG/FlaF family flagellin (archaellin)
MSRAIVVLLVVACVVILAAIVMSSVYAVARTPITRSNYQQCAACTLKPSTSTSKLATHMPSGDEIASARRKGVAAAREQIRLLRRR